MGNKKEDVSFIRHFLNVGIGTFINLLLGFISTPLITRIADPSEYGQLSIFNAYADIALAILFIGLDRGIVRYFYAEEKAEDKKSLLKLCFLGPMISAFAVLIVYFVLSNFNVISTRLPQYVMLLLFTYVIVCIWNRLSLLMLRLTYQTARYSFVTVVQKVVYVLIIVLFALAIKGEYLLMLIMALLVSTFAGAVCASVFTKEYWSFKHVSLPTNSTEILRYSIPFVAYSCMDALLNSMDKLSIDYFLSDYETGIYSSALSLVSIFMVVKTVFDTIWVPMQTEQIVKNPDDRSFIQKGNRYVTIILMFLCINVVMFKDLLCYILGESYRGANVIIPFLIFGTIMYAISDTAISGIEYSKNSYLHALISLLALGVNFAGNTLMVPCVGPQGAALATCLSFAVYLVLRIYFSNKYYYIDYGIKKLTLICLIVFGFCFVNTFYALNVFTVVLYLLCMVTFFVLYFRDIQEMVLYGLDILKKRMGK